MTLAIEVSVPAGSALLRTLNKIDFADAFQVGLGNRSKSSQLSRADQAGLPSAS